MSFGTTSAPRHPSGCSGFPSIRWGCRCGRSLRCSSGLALIVPTERSGTGPTRSRRTRLTRQRRSRRGSPLMRSRSPSTAKKVALRCCRHRLEATARYRGVQPTRDRSRVVHESEALVQPIRTQSVLRTAFLHRLITKHEVADTEFLVDAGGYLTALARRKLSGQLNYTERNLIEKLFQTVAMRIDHFHSFWRGSPASARRWLRRFSHHYSHDRPNQALNG